MEVELLAPAGSLEKLKVALVYGADAVYFGLPDFSLRARSNQFSKEDIIEAEKICRQQKKKFYITMNIYAHNIHLPQIRKQLEWLREEKIKPDGIIISDPGIIQLVQEILPDISWHLSTQANATNVEAVKFWQKVGCQRVILAREVTIGEIEEIHQELPEMELETFVQGAMCMSYSGRCMLSKWMTNRSANLGDCAQPCRWLWQDTKEERKKEKEVIDDKNRFAMKIEEDQHGTYLFNSRDLSLIEHLEKLYRAGIYSFKIEGRAKSIYYLATVVRAYRQVIDCFKNNGKCQDIIKQAKEELKKISNRGYWTGFIFGDEPPHLFDKAYLATEWEFAGTTKMIFDKDNERKRKRLVFVHNKLLVGDQVELITPDRNITAKIKKIINEDGESVESAHGGLNKFFLIEFNQPVPSIFLLRRKKI